MLQTTQPSEVAQLWAAGSQPFRLAAYYVVSVVLFEPKRPSRYAGRVLHYGVPTFVRGAPRLDASRSTVVFRVPGETTNRQVEVQPAEAPGGAVSQKA